MTTRIRRRWAHLERGIFFSFKNISCIHTTSRAVVEKKENNKTFRQNQKREKKKKQGVFDDAKNAVCHDSGINSSPRHVDFLHWM